MRIKKRQQRFRRRADVLMGRIEQYRPHPIPAPPEDEAVTGKHRGGASCRWSIPRWCGG